MSSTQQPPRTGRGFYSRRAHLRRPPPPAAPLNGCCTPPLSRRARVRTRAADPLCRKESYTTRFLLQVTVRATHIAAPMWLFTSRYDHSRMYLPLSLEQQ